jgi:[ribosomal protein S5]-alanine N-acetyltransferase
MTVFPVLHTSRLMLRQISIDDIAALIKYANNKKISDNVLNIPYPYREPDAVFRISYAVQGFKNKTRYVFAIILKESEELIGEISLHLDGQNPVAELGYWIGEPFWGKGIATEAAGAILHFGFGTLHLRLVFATCHEDNEASQKVLVNNGMQRGKTTGHVIQYIIKQEAYELIKTNG